jgi:hypothetical protein
MEKYCGNMDSCGVICPRCGSKGKKKPHTPIISTEEAKKYSWYDYRCGSCKRAFKSYI